MCEKEIVRGGVRLTVISGACVFRGKRYLYRTLLRSILTFIRSEERSQVAFRLCVQGAECGKERNESEGNWRCEFPKMGALAPCSTVSGGKWTFLFRGVDRASTLWFVMGEPPESPAHKGFGIAKAPFQAYVCSNSSVRVLQFLYVRGAMYVVHA